MANKLTTMLWLNSVDNSISNNNRNNNNNQLNNSLHKAFSKKKSCKVEYIVHYFKGDNYELVYSHASPLLHLHNQII